MIKNLLLTILFILFSCKHSISESLSDYQLQIQGKKFFSSEEIIKLKNKNILEQYKERELTTPYEGPIIDVHDHPNYKGRHKTKVEKIGPNGPDIVKIKNDLNVVHTIVMNTPGDYKAKKKRANSVKFAKQFDTVSALCRADIIGLKYKSLKSNFNTSKNKIERELKRINKHKSVG